MPVRDSFDCLWCGRPHRVRSPSDLEGFAQLCPECVGRAQENGFLRSRVKAALRERTELLGSPAASPVPGPVAPVASPKEVAPARSRTAILPPSVEELDDWYLRRGPYSRGPLQDVTWTTELDAATRWVDGLPLGGEIVELTAGTGWWSPLLAQKGQLWSYDAQESALDRVRDRLQAHRLRAHIHVRDPWAEPDRKVDGLFTALWLGRLQRGQLHAALELTRRWLKEGGTYAFLETRSGSGGAEGGEAVSLPAAAVPYHAEELERALDRAGFRDARVTTTGSFFLLGEARAG